MSSNKAGALAFTVVAMLGFAYLAIGSFQFQATARYFPLTVGVVGVLVCLVQLTVVLLSLRAGTVPAPGAGARPAQAPGAGPVGTAAPAGPAVAGEGAGPTGVQELPPPPLRRVLRYGAWVLGYIAAIGIAGVFVATAVFLGVFLRLEARSSWLFTGIGTVGVLGFLMLFGELLNMRWPSSLLGL